MKTATAPRPPCRLCELREANVRAHVIPKAFYLHATEDARLISTSPDIRPKRSPIGVYDTGILCMECEAGLSPFDDYGFDFFSSFAQDEEHFRSRSLLLSVANGNASRRARSEHGSRINWNDPCNLELAAFAFLLSTPSRRR